MLAKFALSAATGRRTFHSASGPAPHEPRALAPSPLSPLPAIRARAAPWALAPNLLWRPPNPFWPLLGCRARAPLMLVERARLVFGVWTRYLASPRPRQVACAAVRRFNGPGGRCALLWWLPARAGGKLAPSTALGTVACQGILSPTVREPANPDCNFLRWENSRRSSTAAEMLARAAASARRGVSMAAPWDRGSCRPPDRSRLPPETDFYLMSGCPWPSRARGLNLSKDWARRRARAVGGAAPDTLAR
jgi:hypothetical protein